MYLVARSPEVLPAIVTPGWSAQGPLTHEAGGGLAVLAVQVNQPRIGLQSSASARGIGGGVVSNPGSGKTSLLLALRQSNFQLHTWWIRPLHVHQASSIFLRLYRQDPAKRMDSCHIPQFYMYTIVKSKTHTLTPDLVATQSLSLVWSMISISESSSWQDCWAPLQVCFSSSPDINLVRENVPRCLMSVSCVLITRKRFTVACPAFRTFYHHAITIFKVLHKIRLGY